MCGRDRFRGRWCIRICVGGSGEEEAVYPNEAIREVLHKTLGVPLFQEQAMRLAVVAAGFTPGEADQLRRAMGAWRRPGIIDQFRLKLLAGMEERGLTRHFAEQVFQQIRGFGEYGFPESHAASFALLVYVSAWLKRYHPAAFVAAILNSQPMGFYGPAQLIRDAREHGVEVRPVDVNASDWDCTLEPVSASEQASPAVRLGFRLLTGVSRRVIEPLVAERARRGPYRSVDEVARRTGLRAAELSRLAEADVFRSLDVDRRAALWQTLGQERVREARPLFAALGDDEPLVEGLPELSGIVNVVVWSHVARQQRKELVLSRLMGVTGRVERQGEVVHLIAGKLVDRTSMLADLDFSSREFH